MGQSTSQAEVSRPRTNRQLHSIEPDHRLVANMGKVEQE